MPKPQRFTYPFCYSPHPLAVVAADEVRRAVAANGEWLAEAEKGKMFGVLVVDTADGLAYLAAYSGLFCGRNDWPFFVPPVYDLLHPDGYFKREEDAITAINHSIEALESSPQHRQSLASVAEEQCRAAAEEAAFRAMMADAKAERDRSRGGKNVDDEALVRESQYQKAELRRLRKRNAERVAEKERELKATADVIAAMKNERRERSEALQMWLFSQFSMLNARGERRDLCSIFADTASGIPPSGTGDCCAPKLLQYAYLHGLTPVCMAEFWWGASPKGEIRHHGQYYPACRGKCLPILTHMLQGLSVDPDPLACGGVHRNCDAGDGHGGVKIIYEDSDIIVVDKPSGMLSVPGRSSRSSVFSVLKELYPADDQLMMVHRLDMDTSGLLVVARNKCAHKALQKQFLARQVKKKYTAIVVVSESVRQSSVVHCAPSCSCGTIRLPMRADLLDRPRQVVDSEKGKPAVTEYSVERLVERGELPTEAVKGYAEDAAFALVSLTPHTGRTHQLRLHCAHADGLASPILGDALYGRSANRLYLHAACLAFRHPTTLRLMTFKSESADFPTCV